VAMMSRFAHQKWITAIKKILRSSPNAKSTKLAATATAAPLEDPPGTRAGTAGLVGVP